MAAVFSATEERKAEDAHSATSSTGGLSRSLSSSQLTGYPSQTVFLNVYDLHEAVTFLAPLGCGVFHAGIEVHGREYCYGRDESGNGIDENVPRVCHPHIFREQFVLGVTPLSRFHVEELFRKLMSDPVWDANKYHLIRHNCLHFVQCVAQQLLPVSCRVSLAAQNGGDSSLVVYTGGTQETVVMAADGRAATALSATQMQLPSLIPAHVDRLSRLAATWAPQSVLDWIDHRASASSGPQNATAC